MTRSGTCEECAAPILGAHEHCVICGQRVIAPVPPSVISAGAPRRGIPVRPQAALFAGVLTFAFGGMIGTGIGPSVDSVLAAATPLAPAPAVVAEATDDSSGPAPAAGGGGAADPAPDPAPAPAPVPVVPVTPIPTTPVPTDPVPEEPLPEDPADPGLPPDDETTLAEGIVVRVNENAGSYSIASGGLLTTVHAKQLPDAGAGVKVAVEPLFNGTLKEAESPKTSKGETEATFSGVVTWVAPDGSSYVLSSSGASVPVQVPEPKPGAKPEIPELASSVTVSVAIAEAPDPVSFERRHRRSVATPLDADPVPPTQPADPAQPTEPAAGCAPEGPQPAEPYDPGVVLTQSSFQVEFEDLTVAAAEGIVQAVCEDESEVVISADDLRESATDLTLTVPDDVDLADIEPGDSVLVNLNPTPSEDGGLELSGIAGDTGLKDADDDALGQGDLAG